MIYHLCNQTYVSRPARIIRDTRTGNRCWSNASFLCLYLGTRNNHSYLLDVRLKYVTFYDWWDVRSRNVIFGGVMTTWLTGDEMYGQKCDIWWGHDHVTQGTFFLPSSWWEFCDMITQKLSGHIWEILMVTANVGVLHTEIWWCRVQ